MLRVQDLHVYYGAIHAVKGVSLEVADGEIVTLIGGERRRKKHRSEYDLRPFEAEKRYDRVHGRDDRLDAAQ